MMLLYVDDDYAIPEYLNTIFGQIQMYKKRRKKRTKRNKMLNLMEFIIIIS